MTVYQPQSLDELKDFVNRNTFVVVVADSNEDYYSDQVVYKLKELLGGFERVKCAKVDVHRMDRFSFEYRVQMPCIVYFKNGQKVHLNGSTDRSVIERDLKEYCDN